LNSLFFSYLTTLAKKGQQVGHSKQTKEYYENINEVCSTYLSHYQDRPFLMLKILGWSARLVKYYLTSSIAEETILQSFLYEVDSSKQEVEICQKSPEQSFVIGQVVDAVVLSKKSTGKKITYKILGTDVKLTNREPDKFDNLSNNQKVQVKIIKLEEQKIKKIKLI